MINYIFDLDHTVIDSSNRQHTRADGSLDLDNWRENCTREKIMADKILPLADLMRSAYAKGDNVIVCTARVLSVWDHVFLAAHDLRFHALLSRAEGDNRGDAENEARPFIASLSRLKNTGRSMDSQCCIL